MLLHARTYFCINSVSRAFCLTELNIPSLNNKIYYIECSNFWGTQPVFTFTCTFFQRDGNIIFNSRRERSFLSRHCLSKCFPLKLIIMNFPSPADSAFTTQGAKLRSEKSLQPIWSLFPASLDSFHFILCRQILRPHPRLLRGKKKKKKEAPDH